VISWLVRHRMGPAFSLAASLVLAIILIAVAARGLVEDDEAIGVAAEVLAGVDRIVSTVTAAESAQQAFVATGDDRSRASYEAAAADVSAELDALRALSSASPHQLARLDALEPALTTALAEFREAIRLRRQKGADAVGRARRAMEQLRSIADAVKEQERGLVTEHTARHAQRVRYAFLVLLTLALTTAGVLVGLLMESRRRAGEMRAARDALRGEVAEHEQTSSLLTSLVQSSDEAIIGVGPDGRILTWNRGAERIYGFRQDEARGRTMGTLVEPGCPAQMPGLLEQVRRGENVEHAECEQVARDGRRLHVSQTVSPIRDALGQIIGVSIVARDITAQKEAEQARRRSEATSAAFLESASEGIVGADAAGRIALLNRRTEEMFGYTRAELVGQPIELLIPTRQRQTHARHRATYMAAPRVRTMGRGLDLAGRRKDGTEFPVEVSLSHLRTDEGTLALAFIIDISERLALQRAARQADKLAALGTLSAGIAHEINNPIGVISSRVEVMLLEAEEGELPESLRKDLEVILRHARRVAAITQGLLSFARVSSGVRGPVNLNRIVHEMLQLAQKDMGRAHVTVTTRLDEGLPDIVADANAIGQVLLNLLTNARSAMPEGGEITIETDHLPAAGSARLQVRDTGSGIPPEVLPRIFDPFFTTKPDGTGLGLSISHGIVQDHGATLDVHSEVGKGTTFTLTFPVGASETG
jgi:PAS domain S-box-containing protein